MKQQESTRHTNCDISKCKARCCHNVDLPAKLFEIYPDKMVRRPMAVYPVYGTFVHSVAFPQNLTEFGHPCPFLTMDCRCNIYEERPNICRLWGHSEITPLLGCRDLGDREHRSPSEIPVSMALEAPNEIFKAITGSDKPEVDKEMMKFFKKNKQITMEVLYKIEDSLPNPLPKGKG